MKSTSPRTLTALLALTAGALALGPDRQLKDSDLKDVGKKLAEYIEATRENSKVFEAEQEVRDSLDKIEKKLKGTDPLSLTEDLGYALWLSYDYRKVRVRKGKVDDPTYESSFFGEDGLTYAVWAPSKYNARSGPYPLILTIPDADERPTDHITEQWANNDIRAGAIIAAPTMPEDGGMWAEAGSSGAPGGIAFVLTTLKAVGESYAIDFDRVYLAGRGAGVAAAVAIANRFPDRFAGVIGRAGDVGSTLPDNFRNLPTYFTGAGAEATAFAEAAVAAGFDNCIIDPAGKEEEVWNWIQGNARAANPTRVTLVPGAPFPTRAYWVQVPPSDGKTASRIDASIDRETNTVTIDAEGVTQVTLYFNDLLVDMDQPVKVICNGAEHVDQIPRSFKVTLDLIYSARSDPGKLYVASKSYDVPPKSAEGSEE